MRQSERDSYVRAVWSEAQRRYGIPFEPRLREQVNPEEYFTERGDDEEDKEMFREAVDRVMAIARIFRVDARGISESAGVEANSADGTISGTGRGFYPKCLARQIRILGFVAERAVPRLGVLRGSFRVPRPGIPWKRFWPEWNRTFPLDRMTTSESLRVAYARAVGQRHVREAYLLDLARELLQVVWPESQAGRYVVAQLIASGAAHQIQVRSDRRLLRDGGATLAEVWDASWPARKEITQADRQ